MEVHILCLRWRCLCSIRSWYRYMQLIWWFADDLCQILHITGSGWRFCRIIHIATWIVWNWSYHWSVIIIHTIRKIKLTHIFYTPTPSPLFHLHHRHWDSICTIPFTVPSIVAPPSKSSISYTMITVIVVTPTPTTMTTTPAPSIRSNIKGLYSPPRQYHPYSCINFAIGWATVDIVCTILYSNWGDFHNYGTPPTLPTPSI